MVAVWPANAHDSAWQKIHIKAWAQVEPRALVVYFS